MNTPFPDQFALLLHTYAYVYILDIRKQFRFGLEFILRKCKFIKKQRKKGCHFQEMHAHFCFISSHPRWVRKRVGVRHGHLKKRTQDAMLRAKCTSVLQCVRDIIAFVFKFYTLFTHSLAAELVANPENGLILSDHSRMGRDLD